MSGSGGANEFKREYLSEFRYMERDKKLEELATRYHLLTEEYDRVVCTGPIVNGWITASTSAEMALINKNAKRVRVDIERQAAEHGIGRQELQRAIHLYPERRMTTPENLPQ